MKQYIRLFRDIEIDQPRGDFRTWLQAKLEKEDNISSLQSEVEQLRQENERLRERLATVIYKVGHNDDCIFCRLKDKIATEALNQSSPNLNTKP